MKNQRGALIERALPKIEFLKLGDRKPESMKGKNGVHHGSLAESVRGFFGAQGALAGAKGYESRPGQAKMAEKVAEVIEGKQHLVVEVGIS